MANDKNLLYFCDPSKNTECKKTGCYENGGPCRHTTHAEYADTTDYAFPVTRGVEWAQIVRCRDCKHYRIEICSVYGDIVAAGEDEMEYSANAILAESCKLKCTGCERTGCVYCGFGFHNEKGKTRFQRLAETHPKLYDFAMRGGMG